MKVRSDLSNLADALVNAAGLVNDGFYDELSQFILRDALNLLRPKPNPEPEEAICALANELVWSIRFFHPCNYDPYNGRYSIMDKEELIERLKKCETRLEAEEVLVEFAQDGDINDDIRKAFFAAVAGKPIE